MPHADHPGMRSGTKLAFYRLAADFAALQGLLPSGSRSVSHIAPYNIHTDLLTSGKLLVHASLDLRLKHKGMTSFASAHDLAPGLASWHAAGGGSEWGDLAKLGQMASAAGGGDHNKAEPSGLMSM